MLQRWLWGSEKPGDQACLGDVAIGGNFLFCLIIVIIFIGLRTGYTEGGRGGGGGAVILKL